MDKSKAAAIIVAKMKKPPTEGEASESAEIVAAREVLAALKGDDPAALSEALKAHYDACYEGD